MADNLLRQKSPTRVRFTIRDDENGDNQDILVPIDDQGFVRVSEVQRLCRKWRPEAVVSGLKYEDGRHDCRKEKVVFEPKDKKWDDCEFVAIGSVTDWTPTPKGKRGLRRKKVRVRYGYSWFWGKFHKKTSVEIEPAGYIPVDALIEKTRGCDRLMYRLKGDKGDYDLEAPVDDIFLPHEAHKKGWGAFDDYTIVFQ